ncbi:hypothetical protein J32TS6_32090 [Virgibacillus pantothenticus]|nr:hypothetical protein [Virgibacillus pantothenticus]GIP64654.1 hypothetical protein J32TS6_32090 [Virgibacillus pantothenticus]
MLSSRYWYNTNSEEERFETVCHLAKKGIEVLSLHKERFTKYGLILKEKASKYGGDVYV